MSEDQLDKGRLHLLFSPLVLIRVSSILFFFLMAGHLSAYPWASARGGIRETQLVAAMKAVQFEFMGESSTYWNLYYGWGLLVGVLLLTLASILWLLSDLVRLAPRRVGAISAAICATCSVGAYLSFRFFYIPPFVFFLAIFAILLTVAIQLLLKQTTAP